MTITNIVTKLIDANQANVPVSELARSQPGVLGGLTHAEGKQLMDAFDVRTIAELATSRYVLWAQAVTSLAKSEKTDMANLGLSAILDPSWQKKRLRDIAKASPAVFAGLSEKEAKMIEMAIGVRTVEELAVHPVILKAQVIAHLASFETLQDTRKAA